MALYTIVYASTATKEMSDDDLLLILEKSRTFNQLNGVTGLLLYREGFFIQVLEGEENIIDTLYEKIEHDIRHYNPLLIFKRPITERHFGQWAMGFRSPDLDALKKISGFSDYIHSPKSKNVDDFSIMFESEITRLLYPFQK